jgi:hypothetical protein
MQRSNSAGNWLQRGISFWIGSFQSLQILPSFSG